MDNLREWLSSWFRVCAGEYRCKRRDVPEASYQEMVLFQEPDLLASKQPVQPVIEIKNKITYTYMHTYSNVTGLSMHYVRIIFTLDNRDHCILGMNI